MEPVRKQIVYDDHQQPVQVLISFKDWQRIEQALGASDEPNAKELMQFYGKVDFGGDPLKVQRQMRAEWPA